MALLSSPGGGQDGGSTGVGLSATARHLALGGERSAPRHLASGCRWVGGQAATIDAQLVAKCAEGTEAGKVTDLNFHFKFVEQIQGLEQHAAQLRGLDLSSNNLRELGGLGGMSRLRELKLYGCQITRIQGLEQCVSLAALHLEDNQISVIEGLEHQRMLEYLSLDKNRLSKVGRGLAKLSKLRELHLSQNQLKTLDGVSGLGALEVLSASHNQLQQISTDQLKGLGRLDELRLGGNQLGSLGFLSAGGGASGSSLPPLPCLATLDLSSNLITTEQLRTLAPLPQLIELSLAGNHIEELPITAVASLPSLEILDLSRNRIERPQELLKLKELVSLRELLLEGNPLACDGEALHEALGPLEALEYLDDKVLPAKPASPSGAGGGGEGEDPQTFALTATRALRDTASSLSASGKLGSRPSTASSRPGTAQSMKEAGVKEPLMHLRLKLSDRRFASEDQASQWERQTMSSLAAIEAQIQRTVKQAEDELQDMDKYLQKAQKVLRRQEELKARGALASTMSTLPEDDDSDDAGAGGASSPDRSSFAGRRLRLAVGVAREDHEGPAFGANVTGGLGRPSPRLLT